MKIKLNAKKNIILVDGNGKGYFCITSGWALGRDLSKNQQFFFASPDGISANGVVFEWAKVTHLIKDDAEIAWSGTADELYDELCDNFFNGVSGSGSTNATDDWFEMINGVFYPKLSAFDARYGGGALPELAKSVISFGTSTATQNVVNWTPVPNATQYVVKRGTTTIYTGSLLTFTDTGLTANTSYSYTVTASANGYTPSVSDAASKTTASGGGTNLGNYVGSANMEYTNNTAFDNEGNVTKPDPAAGSPSALLIAFLSNETGFINHTYKAFTIPADGSLPAESSTGVVYIGEGLDPFSGLGDCLCAIWAQSGGQVVYKKLGEQAVYSSQGVLSIGAILQLRIAASILYIEYSNDGGTNWTTLTTIARPAGTIRSKFNIEGNQYRIFNLRQFKG